MRWDVSKYNRDLKVDLGIPWEFDSAEDHMRFDLEAAMANGSEATWFTARLFRFMPFADEQNLDRIAKGFPEQVAMFRREWRGEVLAL